MTPLIEARGLTVVYGQRWALRPTDFVLTPGEAVALVGRNGSGKSSLLRALCGLERAARGEVLRHAESCRHGKTTVEIAYVPQRSQARWDLPFTVADVVAAGSPGRSWWRSDRTARDAAQAALAAVDLADIADLPVTVLSGGQAQRVLLARALVQQPDVMVMDEPLTGLDRASTELIIDLLTSFVADGNSLCCALHEIDVVRAVFGRTAALADGVIIADGPTVQVLDAAGIERIFTERAAA